MSDNKISNELAKAYVQISQTEDDGTSSLHSDIEYNSINKKIPKQKNYENEESDIGKGCKWGAFVWNIYAVKIQRSDRYAGLY